MKVFREPEIRGAIADVDCLPLLEQGFMAYSQGRAVIPPVGEMLLPERRGEVHIKYGYLRDDDYYVVKIASGFYDNHRLGLSSSQGLVLLFDQKTGCPLALLDDGGFLTDLRTAIAGAIAANLLAPRPIQRIGILGNGTQARYQLRLLKTVTPCREVMVWGRHRGRVESFCQDMGQEGFAVRPVDKPADVARACNLIITTTPSTTPLLLGRDIRKGTHITAVGSDTPEKQELDETILARADLVVADSIRQCRTRGEIYQAQKKQVFGASAAVELGHLLASKVPARSHSDQISVADLTGVAVQDLQIAKLVFARLRKKESP